MTPTWLRFRADALLLLTAMIWGTAFVAQRAAMEHLGPMTFNGVRFALGSLALTPLCLIRRERAAAVSWTGWRMYAASAAAGLVLFAGATLQQAGLVYTTAGKAGFITGLYVVLVPLLGLGIGRRAPVASWVGATLASAGLYLLCVTGSWVFDRGDLLVLAGAFFWAAHILVLDRVSPRLSPFQLATLQAAVCGGCSLIAAPWIEPLHWPGLRAASLPICYAGLMSVTVAYTLQIIAQKEAPPTHAAILLSLEAVFAALAGWWWLGEQLGPRGLVGCALMLGGMVLSSLKPAPPTVEPCKIPAARHSPRP